MLVLDCFVSAAIAIEYFKHRSTQRERNGSVRLALGGYINDEFDFLWGNTRLAAELHHKASWRG